MKKFNFKLDAVLKQRKRREELAQKDLATALKEVQKVQEKIKAKERELETCFANSPQMQGGKMSVHDMIDNRRFVEHVYIEIDELQRELAEKQQVAQHRQYFLIQAAQEHKAMSKLKENKQEEWSKEALSYEQKILDEVGLHMSQRRSSS